MNFKNYLVKNKKSVIGLLAFILYLILSYGEGFILNLIGYNSLPRIFQLIIFILYDLFILLCLIFIYLKILIKDLKDFKVNFKYYLDNYFKYWLLNIGLMLIASLVVSNITGMDNASNQEYVEEVFTKLPLFTCISTIFIAPITEELVFRTSFNHIFKNNLLFIFLSGFTFGLMHMNIASSLLELLYIIPYSIPGFIFAYILRKSNNNFISITMHTFHNTIMVILQIITMLIL